MSFVIQDKVSKEYFNRLSTSDNLMGVRKVHNALSFHVRSHAEAILKQIRIQGQQLEVIEVD